EHVGGSAGGSGHVETVLAEPGADAVVHHHAVLAQHQTVAAAADTQLVPGVGVDAIEELGCVRARDLDLAQGGGVEDADAGAYRAAFAIHRLVHRLAGPGVVPGALPLADVLEQRAVFGVPLVHGGL